MASSHHLIIHPYSHPASIARSLEPWPCSPRWHRLSRRAWASLCQLLVSTCPSLLSASSRLPVVSLRSVLERPLASPLDPLASTLVHPPPVRDSRRATGVLLLLTPTPPPMRCRDVRKPALSKACQAHDPRTHTHPVASRRTVRQAALVLHRSIAAPSPQVVWLVHLKHANARPISTSSCTSLSLPAYARRIGSMPPCALVSYYIRALRLSS